MKTINHAQSGENERCRSRCCWTRQLRWNKWKNMRALKTRRWRLSCGKPPNFIISASDSPGSVQTTVITIQFLQTISIQADWPDDNKENHQFGGTVLTKFSEPTLKQMYGLRRIDISILPLRHKGFRSRGEKIFAARFRLLLSLSAQSLY